MLQIATVVLSLSLPFYPMLKSRGRIEFDDKKQTGSDIVKCSTNNVTAAAAAVVTVA